MKKFAVLLLLLALPVSGWALEKDWKGKPYENKFNVGVLGGIGILDGIVGFSLPVTIATTIVERGFADMNNQVQLEAEAGPLFVSGFTGFQWSAHLRWDFNKDTEWTFYALLGVGGAIVSKTTEFYPHLGIGTIWYVFETISLRAELSHEFIGAGINVAF